MFDVFIGLLFAGSVWFAYVCGRTDCQKNGCVRTPSTDVHRGGKDER